jgi:hypothetical protein
MLNKDDIRDVVIEKLKERNGAFNFLSDEYLNVLIKAIVESLDEYCNECRMKRKDK